MDKITKVYSIGDKTYKTDEQDIIIFRIRYFKVVKTLQKLYL